MEAVTLHRHTRCNTTYTEIKIIMKTLKHFLLASISLTIICLISCQQKEIEGIHVYEIQEITLNAQNQYDNPYTDVECWVNLKGPDFNKRIYGFWDGGQIFKVRVTALQPGEWSWVSGSTSNSDTGLNGHTGSFTAYAWTEKEKAANNNRRGFVQATPNGHALQYTDGTPFFLIGDTWLGGATWRLPFRNASTSNNYIPGPGIGFEDAVMYRKKQGFNSVSMISCFPNWESDIHPWTYADANGVYLRNPWEKFDYMVDAKNATSKNMRDEYGNRPFKMSKEHDGVADINKIIPEYFKSLDKKMMFLSEQGMTPLLESVRRDAGPSWKAYFDFNETYARFIQYLIARYGAYNMIFSGIHLDLVHLKYGLSSDDFNEALTYHYNKYGPLPFGQLHTTLINNSTYTQFGHNEDCPWLNMHSVGNKPRNHKVSDSLIILFHLEPPYPAINFEPYYAGWSHVQNRPNGELPPVNSTRDNYFARAQMYGSVLSGGLSGHVYGTAAYDITTTGEPAGERPHFWDAIQYESGGYMQHLSAFILSEGNKYQNLQPARKDMVPHKSPGSPETGLDGWSYMMRTPEKDFALLYFENQSVLPELHGFIPDASYSLSWFDPLHGIWKGAVDIQTNNAGVIDLVEFPDMQNPTIIDWAAKIIQK